MENPGIGLPELLVAPDVTVHWTVCKYLQLMPLNQAPTPPPGWGASPTPSIIIRLGQAFRHQEMTAVIDGQLWELE